MSAPARPGFAPPLQLEQLLQAILAPPAMARPAFSSWCEALDFDELPDAHFCLLGELAGVIDRLAPEYPHLTRVRGIQKYIWSNNIHILRTALPALDEFTAASIPFVVLKGAGVIAGSQVALQRRFIRDLDLLVLTEDLPRAANLLMENGWRPVYGRIPGRIRAQPFDHSAPVNPHAPKRVEIDLHHRVLHFGRTSDFDDVMMNRSRPGVLLGRKVRVLSVVDHALQTLCHAFRQGLQPSYGWVVDAVRVLRTPDFDWDDFFHQVERRRICWHMYSVLTYLSAAFALPVPSLDHLALSQRFPWERSLHEAEICAVARNRLQRGITGKAVMFAAELLRSRRLFQRVDFKTDYGIAMRREYRVSSPVPAGAPYLATLTPADNGVLVEVSVPGAVKNRFDFDLWADGRWYYRLRIRSVLIVKWDNCWRAICKLPAGCSEILLMHAQSAAIVAKLNLDPGKDEGRDFSG